MERYGKLDLDLMKKFSLTNGISGHEKKMAQLYRDTVEDSVDEIEYDALGSVIAYKKGHKGPRIMLAGHLDEIGFLVKNIEDGGYLRLQAVGGWWPHVLPSQAVVVETRDGQEYTGVVGSKAPHGMKPEVRNKVMALEDLFVDLGVDSKEEVLSLGIQIGDSITPKAEFNEMANPNYLLSKAWDDRIGAYIVAEVMRNLKNESLESHVYGVGTVQEEVGLRGAKTAAQKINPDISFALDVTIATDSPGEDNRLKLGVGPCLSVMDGSHIAHKGLLYAMQDLAEELEMDYQFDMLAAGGTDSGEIHKVHDGVISMTLSIPARYIHSHRGVIHRRDVADTIVLLTEFIKRMNEKSYDDLVNYKR